MSNTHQQSPHLCTNHHVLDDVVHVRDKRGDVRVQQHHQRPAHVLAHIRVIVHCQVEEVLRKTKVRG